MQNVPPEAQNIVRFALLLSVSRECAIFNFPLITMLNFNKKKNENSRINFYVDCNTEHFVDADIPLAYRLYYTSPKQIYVHGAMVS